MVFIRRVSTVGRSRWQTTDRRHSHEPRSKSSKSRFISTHCFQATEDSARTSRSRKTGGLVFNRRAPGIMTFGQKGAQGGSKRCEYLFDQACVNGIHEPFLAWPGTAISKMSCLSEEDP